MPAPGAGTIQPMLKLYMDSTPTDVTADTTLRATPERTAGFQTGCSASLPTASRATPPSCRRESGLAHASRVPKGEGHFACAQGRLRGTPIVVVSFETRGSGAARQAFSSTKLRHPERSEGSAVASVLAVAFALAFLSVIPAGNLLFGCDILPPAVIRSAAKVPQLLSLLLFFLSFPQGICCYAPSVP